MAIERLQSVEFSGFKSIREVSLKLEAFNVLIGANGAGKSNFIDFFQMLNYMFGSTQGNLQLFVEREGGSSDLLHYSAKVTRNVDADLVFKGEGGQSRYRFSLAWGRPDKFFFADEYIGFTKEGSATESNVAFEGGHRETAILDLAGAKKETWERKVARVFSYRLRQLRAYHFHDTSENAPVRLNQDVARGEYLMGNAGNLAAFLLTLQRDAPLHYKQILSTVQLIAPFISDFVIEPFATNSSKTSLRWKDRSGEQFAAHQLSDGTIRAIALVTALLQPDETMPSILLFDEPELGLHPAGVSLIAGLLKSAAEKRQVIVATQSPILIQDYAPEDVIVVERKEDAKGKGESTFTRLQKESLEAWLEDFDLGELYEKNVTGGYPK